MKRVARNLVLAAGYLAVAMAILVARANPASNYEISMYASTPTLTWLGIGLAFAIAVSAALLCRGRVQAAAIGLGGLAVTTIVSMSLIRNYRFAGLGDALTHLGWTRDLLDGSMVPQDLFYPGLHTAASVVHLLSGIPVERAILLLVVVLFVPFLLFVPLTVRDLSGSGLAVGIAAIVSWFLLPINNVGTHMGAHTNSNALFLVPVVLFAVVAYLHRGAGDDRLPFGLSPFTALILVSGLALLLVHPQQMISLVVLLGAIAAVQYLASWRFTEHPILEHPTMYAHTLVLGAAVGVWSLSNERFRGAIEGLLTGLVTEDVGGGATVEQRGTSLTEIGGSLGELFVLMFLEAAIIGAIVALFILAVWLGFARPDRQLRAFTTYFGIALFPLGVMFVVYFAGTPTMAFRQVGFIYVLLTILAGVAIAHAAGGLSRLTTPSISSALVATLLAACLVLGAITIYASPIIYQPSQHVSDQQMDGYQAGYAYSDEERPHLGLGFDPYRFDHGINGVEEESLTTTPFATGTVDPETFEEGNYSGSYEGHSYYLFLSEFDTSRELDVYQELHFSSESVENVERDPAVNKAVSNDEFRMYAVTGSDV
ncbi:hypothetical protein OB905_02740 [Halobacteria archaeon AArc-dxtr1]|nr:hypothetical protein [Halobacteria archaeon AArc-dxtr1]